MTDPPEWTEFNESDPGITLLQIFAFLALAILLTAGLFLVSRWWRRREE